ncbi:DUF1707 domain-containing protein [Amycolatopsis sp. YIM 10]|uniref:DUF1707 SHOCT-like domain-containing protein n=1 Tax=Amycolatopsis sp. YIM 10 TaxID=2653857 RepID=UPI0012A93E3B|nr:DUF1707 domain-containing protein [Amycolatopsis sp. YIM 10]QFU94735.1 hypothetical protein YIM_48050 [Amycolatopsis sp. YIM 10]
MSDRELRVSDAERDHVAALLQKAVGQGLLDLEEFTARTDLALAARTRGELNRVLTDLPGLVHHGVNGTVPARRDRLVLRTLMGGTRRTGHWRVPHEILVQNQMGSTELDFTEAEFSQAEVRIELSVAAGSVELLLPATASLSTSDVKIRAGTLTDRTEFDRAAGKPRFVLSGSVFAGSVEIRTPRYYRFGRVQVRLPWRVTWGS